MKKILAISILVFGLTIANGEAQAYTIRQIKNVPTYSGTTYNAYSNDLAHIEEYLFGKTYPNENVNNRINRIEKKIFNKTYSTMNTSSRMNNILANYRKYDSFDNFDGFNTNSNFFTNSNTGTSYYSRTSNYTPTRRIYNRFIGQPTGFTPPIMNSPFHRNSFGPRINRSIYRPRTFGYNNFYPTSSRAGIRILP